MSENLFKELAVSELKEKQSWDLDKKIEYAKEKIKEFVEFCGGVENVFVSFSGGKTHVFCYTWFGLSTLKQ